MFFLFLAAFRVDVFFLNNYIITYYVHYVASYYIPYVASYL